MDDFDIYADLSDPNQEEEDNEKLGELKEKYQNLEKELNELKSKLEKLEGINDTLKTNFSSLLKTAKAEITRKDRAISDLRAQLDTTLFRRNRQHNNEKKAVPKPFVSLAYANPQEQLQLLFQYNFSFPPPSMNSSHSQINQQFYYDNNHQVSDQSCTMTKSAVSDDTAVVHESVADELVKMDYFCPKETNNSDCDSDDGIIKKSEYRSTVYGERLRKKLLEEKENERKNKEYASSKERENEKRNVKEEKSVKEKEKEKQKLGNIPIENKKEIDMSKKENEPKELLKQDEQLKTNKIVNENFIKEGESETRKKEFKMLHETEIKRKWKEDEKLPKESEKEKRHKEGVNAFQEKENERRKKEANLLKEYDRDTRKKEELQTLPGRELLKSKMDEDISKEKEKLEKRKIEEEKLLKEKEKENRKIEEEKTFKIEKIDEKRQEEQKILNEKEKKKRIIEEELKQRNETFDKVNNKENLSIGNESMYKIDKLLSNENLDNVKLSSEVTVLEKILSSEDICSEDKLKFKHCKDENFKIDKYIDTNSNGTYKESKNYSHGYNGKNNYNISEHKDYRDHDNRHRYDKHKYDAVHHLKSSHRSSKRDSYKDHSEENDHRNAHRRRLRDDEKSSDRYRHKDTKSKDYKKLRDKQNRTPRKIKLHKKYENEEIESKMIEKHKKYKNIEKVKTPKRKRRSDSQEKPPRKRKRSRMNIDNSDNIHTLSKIEVLKTNTIHFEAKENIEVSENIKNKKDHVKSNSENKNNIFKSTFKSDEIKNLTENKILPFDSKNVEEKDKIESLLEEIEDGEIIDTSNASFVDEEKITTNKTETNVAIITNKSDVDAKEQLIIVKNRIYDTDSCSNGNKDDKSELVIVNGGKETFNGVEPKNDGNEKMERETLISILSHDNSAACDATILEQPAETKSNVTESIQETNIEIQVEQNIKLNISKIDVETVSKNVKEEIISTIENVKNVQNTTEKQIVKELQVHKLEVKENCPLPKESMLRKLLEKKETKEKQLNNSDSIDKMPLKSVVKTDMTVKNKNDGLIRTPVDISKLKSSKNFIICKRRKRPVQLSDSPPVIVISYDNSNTPKN